MEMNGFKHADDSTVVVPERPPANIDKAPRLRPPGANRRMIFARKSVSSGLKWRDCWSGSELCSELRYRMTPATAMTRRTRKAKPISGLLIALAAFAAIR